MPSEAALDLTEWLGTCSSCPAEVAWATTAKGSRMPVNVKPSDTGNVLLTVDGGDLHAGVLGRNQAAGARAAGVVLRTSHFTDCPRADEHRKPPRGRTRR